MGFEQSSVLVFYVNGEYTKRLLIPKSKIGKPGKEMFLIMHTVSISKVNA